MHSPLSFCPSPPHPMAGDCARHHEAVWTHPDIKPVAHVLPVPQGEREGQFQKCDCSPCGCRIRGLTPKAHPQLFRGKPTRQNPSAANSCSLSPTQCFLPSEHDVKRCVLSVLWSVSKSWWRFIASSCVSLSRPEVKAAVSSDSGAGPPPHPDRRGPPSYPFSRMFCLA